MTFYDNLQATGARLLAKYGRDVTLRKSTLGAYDPSTSQQARSTVDTVYKGAPLNFQAGITQLRGELVRISDKRLLLEGAANPTPKDSIIIGATQYVIISIAEVNPAGTSVLYDIHLRQ